MERRCHATALATIAIVSTVFFAGVPASRAADEVKADAASIVRLTPEEIAAGWISLFDGEAMFGWKPNNDVNWHIADGVVLPDRGEPGLLVTTTLFGLRKYLQQRNARVPPVLAMRSNSSSVESVQWM